MITLKKEQGVAENNELTSLATSHTAPSENVATAATLLPLLGSFAISIGQNPLLLMIPGALACSMAFMLPVATPPNAMVFSVGKNVLKKEDMMKVGVVMNVVAVLIISCWIFIGGRLFGIEINELPKWIQ